MVLHDYLFPVFLVEIVGENGKRFSEKGYFIILHKA